MNNNVNLNPQINPSNAQNTNNANEESVGISEPNIQVDNSHVQPLPEGQIDAANLDQRIVSTTEQTDNISDKIAKVEQEIGDTDQEIEDISGKISDVNQRIEQEKIHYHAIKADFAKNKDLISKMAAEARHTLEPIVTSRIKIGKLTSELKSIKPFKNPKSVETYFKQPENVERYTNLYATLWSLEDQLNNPFFLGFLGQSKDELEKQHQAILQDLDTTVGTTALQLGESKENLAKYINCFIRAKNNAHSIPNDLGNFFSYASQNIFPSIMKGLIAVDDDTTHVQAQVEEFSNRFLELIVEKATLDESLNELQAKRDRLDEDLTQLLIQFSVNE